MAKLALHEQVEHDRWKAKRILIKGKACGMLASEKSVAETTSELQVLRRTIERWRSNGFPLFDKPRSGRPRQTDSDERVVGAALMHGSLTNFKRDGG